MTADVKRPSQREFVAMMAMLFATTALSIDAMLPALPAIAAELAPQDTNKAQLVISMFFAGLGAGTLVAGPVSDAIGRKISLLGCAVIYIAGAVMCAMAHSLEMLLLARFIQGVGACGPRAIGTAMIRDQFKGRDMARVVSFVMMIFTIVPAIAPLVGQGLLLFGGWREIFGAFVVFTLLIQSWVSVRQPETLRPEVRRPLHLGLLVAAARELLTHRVALVSTACQALTLGCLVALLSSQQSIFDQHFDRAATFPLWFALIAICSVSGSFLNTRVVVRHGMRRVITLTYVAQFTMTLAILGLNLSGLMSPPVEFASHVLWSIGIFGMMGLCMGNLNALAMESLGHIAGFAASMIIAFSTVGSVLIAIPVGLAFDGTQIPLLIGGTVFSGVALVLMQLVARPTA